MKLVCALLWLLFLSPAYSDSLTITLASATGTCAAGCTKAFSDTTSATPNTLQSNIISAYQGACNVSINGTCTAGQVLTYWATNIKNTFVTAVTSYQVQQLQNAAASGYTPINPQ